MPGTMANVCFTQELEDVASRLLPPEIFDEIETVGTTAPAAPCRSTHAVIEELAMHLNSILGLADMRTEHRPPQANAIPFPSDQQILWSIGEDGIGSDVLLRNNGGMADIVPGFGEDDLALRSVAVQMMFAERPLPVRHYNEIGTCEFRPMRRQNATSGTGVFFPRTEVCRTRSSKSPGNNGAKPQRLMWKEAPMTMKQ